VIFAGYVSDLVEARRAVPLYVWGRRLKFPACFFCQFETRFCWEKLDTLSLVAA